MKLVINEKYIKRNKLIGQITTFGSLAILAIGLMFAFSKEMSKILYSYGALIVGFILSQVGMSYTSRFGRSPRFDEIFSSMFEKLRHDYSFFVYSSPLPMVLIGPCGIWIPVPLQAAGKISYSDGKWRQQGGNFMMKLIGQEGLGKPEAEIKSNTEILQKYLQSQGIASEELPPIRHIMVVVLKSTELGDVTEAPIPVVHLTDLKRYIRREDRENCTTPLSEEQLGKLNEVMERYTKKNS